MFLEEVWIQIRKGVRETKGGPDLKFWAEHL